MSGSRSGCEEARGRRAAGETVREAYALELGLGVAELHGLQSALEPGLQLNLDLALELGEEETRTPAIGEQLGLVGARTPAREEPLRSAAAGCGKYRGGGPTSPRVAALQFAPAELACSASSRR